MIRPLLFYYCQCYSQVLFNWTDFCGHHTWGWISKCLKENL